MASVTFTGVTLHMFASGVNSVLRGTTANGTLADSTGYAVPDALKAAGVTGDVFLRQFQLGHLLSSRIQTSAIDSGAGGDTGPELSTAWEDNPTAITVRRAGSVDSFVAPGPNAPGSGFVDPTEPYDWQMSLAKRTEFRIYAEGVGTGTYTDWEITLDDGVAPPPVVPVLPAIADVPATAGVAGSITLPEANAGDTPISYNVLNLVAGVSFDTTTRLLSWTTAVTAGTTTFTYRATNVGGIDEAPFDFIVAAGTVPLALTDFDDAGLDMTLLALFTKNVDGDYIFRASGRGGSDVPIAGDIDFDSTSELAGIRLRTGATIRLHDAGTLNLGTYFSTGAGSGLTLYGQVEAGADPTELVVADDYLGGAGGFANFTGGALRTLLDDLADGARFILALGEVTQVLTAPTLPVVMDVQATAGIAGSMVLPAGTGNPTPSHSILTALPTGVSFTASTRTLAWTTAVEAGVTRLTYRASNSQGDADRSFDFLVLAELTAPSLPAIPPISAVVVVPGSVNLPAATGNPVPALAATGLPTGFSFTDHGGGLSTISWNATIVAGSYAATVTATNSQGSDTEDVAITVSDSEVAPVFAVIQDIMIFEGVPGSAALPQATGIPAPQYSGRELPHGVEVEANRIVWTEDTVVGSYASSIYAYNDIGEHRRPARITVQRVSLRPSVSHDIRIGFRVEPTGRLPGWAFWNGNGVVVVDGVAYTAGEVAALNSIRSEIGGSQPVEIQLRGTDDLFRAWLYEGPGIREATIPVLSRLTGNFTGPWKEELSILGLLSYSRESPDLGFSVGVDSEVYAPSPKVATRLSAEAQKAEFDNDKGCDNLIPLSQKFPLVWPR